MRRKNEQATGDLFAAAGVSSEPVATTVSAPLIDSALVAESAVWLSKRAVTLGNLLASDRAAEYVAILRAFAKLREGHEPEPLHESVLREVIDRRSREVFERIFMGEVMQRLYVNYMQIDGLVKRIQRKLAGRWFGSNRYEFTVAPLPEYEGFVELVRKGHLLDVAEGKDELRTYSSSSSPRPIRTA